METVRTHARVSELCILKLVTSLRITRFPETDRKQHLIETLHSLRDGTYKKRFVAHLQSIDRPDLSTSFRCAVRAVSVQKNIHPLPTLAQYDSLSL